MELLIVDGHRQLLRTPYWPYSTAMLFVNIMMPALVTPYTQSGTFGIDRIPRTDEMFTMLPQWFFIMMGRAAFVILNVPIRLVSISSFQSSSDVSWNGAGSFIVPALFTRMSILSNVEIVCSRASSTSASFLISETTVSTFFLSPISEATFASLSLFLPISTTLQPSEESLFDTALPTPPPAPVTSATFPFNPFMRYSSPLCSAYSFKVFDTRACPVDDASAARTAASSSEITPATLEGSLLKTAPAAYACPPPSGNLDATL